MNPNSSGCVVRGGGWYYFPASLRSAQRNYGGPALRGDYLGFRLTKTKGVIMSVFKDDDFIDIKPGKFLMGSPESEKNRFSDEDQKEVEIKESFAMQKTHVTQAQWQAIMGNNPSYFKGDDLPVDSVSWNDCQEFIKKLNEIDPGKNYRLPSEAEYEYCCRAGTTTAYFFGDDEEDLDQYAWHYNNSGSKTHPVGMKKPNPWGLYDMIGNLWSWCQDVYK